MNESLLSIVLGSAIALLFLYLGYRVFFKIKVNAIKKQFFVELCPQCGSADKEIKTGLIGITPTTYRCINCNYAGNFVLVEKDDVEKFRKKVKT